VSVRLEVGRGVGFGWAPLPSREGIAQSPSARPLQIRADRVPKSRFRAWETRDCRRIVVNLILENLYLMERLSKQQLIQFLLELRSPRSEYAIYSVLGCLKEGSQQDIVFTPPPRPFTVRYCLAFQVNSEL